MGTFDEWLTGVRGDALGRLWYSHVQYERHKGRLTDEAWNAFQQAVSDRLSAGAGSDPRDGPPLKLIEDVVRDHQAELCCQGPPTTPPAVRFSRVVNAFTFNKCNLKSSTVGNIVEEKVTIDQIWKRLDDPHVAEDYKGWMEGWMGGALNHFWIAPTDAIEAVLAAGGNAAGVRDLLGLGGYEVDSWLLRVDIPASRIAGKNVRIPTTLDAGTYSYYTPSDDPAQGWTLHLKSLSPGAPELVIEKMPFDREYRHEKLGRVDRPCPPIDWAAWAALCEARP